jgi:hypothetical protein
VFTEGTDINIILAAASAMADEGIRHLAMRIAALYLDSAEGEDLDRLVADRFSPELFRKPASPAVVLLFFTRAPPSTLASIAFAVGTKFRTETGIEFQLLEPVGLAPGATGPVTARAEAVLAGVGGNVDRGQIRAFVQTPTDPYVQVVNAGVAAGGANRESDSQLRQRARAYYQTVRRGTLPAIELGALSVPGVASASAEEVIDPVSELPAGPIRLSIADANGQANALLVAAVRQGLREYRAAGVPVDILASKPQYVSISYEGLAFRANVDTTAAAAQLRRLTVSAVNLLGPREPLLRSLLFSIARSIPGAIVTASVVRVPAGDLFPTSGESVSFRTTIDRVKVNGV